MKDSDKRWMDVILTVLATIAELYPHSSIAKKMESDDQAAYDRMLRIWSRALAGKHVDQIKRGLDVLVKSGKTFDPSVPEFVEMCNKPPASHQLYKGLPYHDKPDPNGPARIDHYPENIQRQLKKIGMVPKPSETHHDFCMRCKKYTVARHPELA